MTGADDGRATFEYGSVVREGETHIVWRRIGTHDIIFTRPWSYQRRPSAAMTRPHAAPPRPAARRPVRDTVSSSMSTT